MGSVCSQSKPKEAVVNRVCPKQGRGQDLCPVFLSEHWHAATPGMEELHRCWLGCSYLGA